MITQDMGVDQRIQVLERASRLVGRRGFIAGGYVRDAMFLQVPKDMDIFVKMPPERTRERLLGLASNILRQFGYEPDVETFDAHEDAYGNIQGGVFVCVKGKSENPVWGPIDIIFSENIGYRRDWFVEDNFDLDICKCYISNNHIPMVTPLAMRAFRGEPQVISTTDFADMHPAKDMARRLEHIREKYPTVRLEWGTTLNTPLSQRLYFEYLKEGVIGDPRAVLQEEAEGVNGNELRLNAGEIHQRDRNLEIILDELQAVENQVHDNQGVQPGLRVFDWR